ncbi:sensor histidine kinase [Xanthobacter sp. TB0139]|uniref:sensor histidine kinase n=1 Tax=Xanthobacter sp. TB0139 TaxID=3459178 RepID=UPI004039879A
MVSSARPDGMPTAVASPSGSAHPHGGGRQGADSILNPAPSNPAPDQPPRTAPSGLIRLLPLVLAPSALILLLVEGFGMALFPAATIGGFTALLLTLAGLVVRNRQLARALQQVEEQARAAQAAHLQATAESQSKSRFLAEMSHELRTPLNTVMGFSEMMAQEVLGPHSMPAYAGYARDIHASGRHLLSLADDLLDLARIESGHRILLETPVRLDHLGQDCLTMMQPEASRRQLHLAPALEAVQIWGDERALRQIALNLLANAVKFTPSGGEVRLEAGIGPDGVPHLAVADTGPGISTGELPLETAHHRDSRLDVTTGRGAGLGLAIVRGLAQLHGGDFALLRRMGGGTRARVRLPASRVMPLAPAFSTRSEKQMMASRAIA